MYVIYFSSGAKPRPGLDCRLSVPLRGRREIRSIRCCYTGLGLVHGGRGMNRMLDLSSQSNIISHFLFPLVLSWQEPESDCI